MKKRNLIFVTLFALGVVFTSCKKDLDNTAVKIDLTKTAWLTVNVKHVKDSTTFPLVYAPIPADNVVTISIDNSEFNPTGTGVWSATFITDATGSISAELPASVEGVKVNVHVQAFPGSQIQFDDLGDDETLKGHFEHAGSEVTLFTNDNKVLNINGLDFVSGK